MDLLTHHNDVPEVPDAPPEPAEVRHRGGRPYTSSGKRNSAYEHAARYRSGRARALKCGEILRSCNAAATGAQAINRIVGTVGRYGVVRGEQTDEAAAVALERAFGLGPYEKHGECADTVPRLVARLAWARNNYGFGLFGERWEAEGGLYWPRTFELIHQDSIVGWVPDEAGRVVGAKQLVRGESAGEVTIPLYEVTRTTRLEDEGGAEGVPVLRHVFAHYDDWLDAVRARGVTIQRFGVPSVEVQFLPDVAERFGFVAPEGADEKTRATYQARLQAEMDRLDVLAARYTSHHRGRVVWPPWVTVTLFGGPEQSDPARIQPTIDAAERGMLEASFHGWMTAGRAGSGGSYNLVEVQKDAAVEAAIADVEHSVDDLNAGPVARFMRWNFSHLRREQWPSIGVTFPKRAEFVKRIGEIMQGARDGLFTLSPEDERVARLAFDMPEAPEEAEQRGPRERLRGTAIATARATAQVDRPSARDLVSQGRARNANSNTEEAA